MIEALKRAWANFRGFDLTGSTVPPMDGPLRPNAKLDTAPLLLRLDGIDNLTQAGDWTVCSVEDEVLTLAPEAGPDGAAVLAVVGRRGFGARVTSLAATAGTLAIAVEGKGIFIEKAGEEPRLIAGSGMPSACITAMAFAQDNTLFVTVGSADNPAVEWKRDLMTMKAAGSVWRIDVASGAAKSIASGLAFPAGLAIAGKTLFVSEAWRHRVLSIGHDGSNAGFAVVGLPAYPGRIAPSSSGGFWLAMFAPRNPLVEFVLKEDAYRERMVATIDPAYWIAPSLVTGKSFLEPIQGGARKKLNMLKPWSPTWSTGLVVRCDALMGMLRSYHSRADGDVHGVTSICETGGRLLVGAKGSGKIVAIEELTERAAT
jgi:hypothetical protein